MKEQHTTVEYTVNAGRCCGCSACKGICPKSAITMRRNEAGFLRPYINTDKCINCSLCKKICPAIEATERSADKIKGNTEKAYIAYSCNAEIRENGQSGGVVTALLDYMLSENIIDGAVISGYTDDEGKSAAQIATTREALISSQGSSYIQNEIVSKYFAHNDKKLAVVLVGCQAKAMKNIEKIIPDKKQAVIKIGLFCGGAFSSNYIKEVKGRLLKNQTCYRYRARDKRYGGLLCNGIFTDGSSEHIVPNKKRIRAFNIWKNYQCCLCTEFFNPESDIVCADPWGVSDRKKAADGLSVLITRTEKGRRLVEQALEKDIIKGNEVSYDDVINGQGVLQKLLNPNYKNEDYYKKLYFSKGFRMKAMTRKRKIIYDLHLFRLNVKGYIKRMIKSEANENN